MLNDNFELDYYLGEIKHNSIKNSFKVTIEDELFNINESIYRGKDKVFNQSYKINKELIEALYQVIKGAY